MFLTHFPVSQKEEEELLDFSSDFIHAYTDTLRED